MDGFDRRTMLGSALALPVLAATSGCGLAGGGGKRFPDYRYRLTIEVDTPEGLRTASSVREVQTYKYGRYVIPDPGKVEQRMNGEALVLDLGERGTLFALHRSEEDERWATIIMKVLTPQPPVTKPEDAFAADFALMLKRRHLIELPKKPIQNPKNTLTYDAYPMLVRFADTAVPTSIAKVDRDDLAASFGDGVSLKRMTVQLTDDPVTNGIERQLPWLSQVGARISGRTGAQNWDDLSEVIQKQDFVRRLPRKA